MTLRTSITSEKELQDEISDEKLSIISQFKKKWQLCVKIMELIFCALCIGFIIEPAKRADLARIHLSHFALIFPTFFAYFLTSFLFLITRVIGDKMPYRTGFIFSSVASFLFFVSGILLALDRTRDISDEFYYIPLPPNVSKFLAISTTITFFTSMLFGAEAYFSFRYKEDF
ncbi:uncharacterized protein [Euwallacea fornicatus]|uniref:uncharacterized protein n=1 Tax=Euwallacea fornicatus TaxID=995702 RepID=UPI00338D6CD4